MANGPTISRDEYLRFVEAFQKLGAKFAPVARLLEVDQRTAAKAWKTGWPTIGFPAISEALAHPELLAQVIGSQQSPPPVAAQPMPVIAPAPESGAASVPATPPAEKSPDVTPRQTTVDPGLAAYVAALQTIDGQRAATMLEEAQVMRAIRNNVLGVQAVTGELLKELHAMAPEMIRELRILREDGARDALGLKAVVSRYTDVLEKSVKAFAQSVDAFGKVQEQNKLLVGEPQKISEVRNTGGAGVDPDSEDTRLAESRLLKQLVGAAARRRLASGAYTGEEGNKFIEVEATPTAAPTAPDSGEPVADEPADEDKAA